MNLVGLLSIGCWIYFGWQADVILCHFLQVCMWSETVFPFLAPAHARVVCLSFGFCNVDVSLHIDGDSICCSWTASLHWVPAYVLFAVQQLSLVLGRAQRPLCPGMCAVPWELWYWLQDTPQTAGFGPKPCVLATEELCVELRSLVCRLMEVLVLIAVGSPNRGKSYFPLRDFCVHSEYARHLGTGLLFGAVQELLQGFGSPITHSVSYGEASVLCRKMFSVALTEMRVILAC